MRNIWKIFTTDIRRISNNVVAVVIIMGLSILPALYAWFNIPMMPERRSWDFP